MARYTDDSKARVLEAVDMVALVGTRTEVQRAGPGRYKARCPFHEERTASFSIDAGQKLYHCFGCGVGGDAISFVRDLEGLDFVGALESLAARFGVELEVEDEDPEAAERRKHRERLLELLERAVVFYERWLWESGEAAPARAYLAERGLEEEVLREFRVGYAPSAWDKLLLGSRRERFTNHELYDAGLSVRARGEGRLYDRFRRRIMFPLTDARGKVLGFGARAVGADQQPKYLNSADGLVFHKGEHVFGAHLARAAAAKADEVVAVEGYTDVLALRQAGVVNTVGIMGTALTDRQIGELAKLGSRVLLALDADSAGQEAMVRAAKLAAGKRLELRVVPLPPGLDPADLVQRHGPERAQELVASSVPFVRFRVERELDQGDTASAEGKDRVIAALKPVFGTLSPSALREELIALVAHRLDLAPSLVGSWLPVPGEAAAQPARRPPPPERAAPAPRDAAARAEEELLAMCLATGAAGEELLGRLTAESFSDALNARTAAYLRTHFAAPGSGLGEDDEELGRQVLRLVARVAAQDDTPSAAAVRGQLARVEVAQLERLRHRPDPPSDLGMRIQQARRRLDDTLAESMEEGRPASLG